MDDNAKTVPEELVQSWEKHLSELEETIAEQTAGIVKRLEEKSARLDEREAELLGRQKFIDECESKLKSLEAAEKTFQIRHQELDALEKTLLADAQKREQAHSERLAKLEKEFQAKSERHAEKSAALDKWEAALLERESTLKERELSLENELAAKKNQAEKDILDRQRAMLDELSAQLAAERQQHGAAMVEQFQNEEQHYVEEFRNALATLKDAFERERLALIQDLTDDEKKRLADIEEREKLVEQRETAQDLLDKDLKREKRRLSIREKSLDELQENLDALQENLDAAVKERYGELLTAKDVSYEQLASKMNDLRRDNEHFRAVKDTFGDKPFEAMNKELDDLRSENKKLKDQILSRPPASVVDELQYKKDECDRLTLERDNLRKVNITLRESAARADELDMKLTIAENKISIQNFGIEELKTENENLRDKMKRLQADEGRLAEREERIKSIETKLPGVNAPATAEADSVPFVNEMDWLENVGRNCYNYGFKFPRRIFYAFHTALKIADWSTITVLAGVSGTGKSALPQLYAKFGGLNFISASVQPNWDSQESMLGFFNSIDNKFDAQPLLRFLAQCSSGKDGMDRSLNIVLLDEMNLAHVEHYFAEFLSKLEARRISDNEFVEINIGAGIEPYHLKLTRNVLWAGTMNQDETTKSLSDKVLDRGLVINFPRPRNLFGRAKLGKIDEFAKDKRIEMLDCRIWDEQWVKKEIALSDKQEKILTHYRDEVFQKINDALASSGRALGHRVWQSVEFYTINYPEVTAALAESEGDDTDKLKTAVKTAMEDQLVQKVMPKLRGIETNVHKDCLKKIRAILLEEDFNLNEDFDRAEKMGYGQFMWNSAEYVDDKDIIGAPDSEKPDDTAQDNAND